METVQLGARKRRAWLRRLLVGLLTVASVLSPSPARANGTGETTVGYLLVQQALGHLAHDTSADGIMLAMEKVDDALKTTDQAGVNVAELQQAKDALAAGQVDQARTLLQSSITEALSHLKPATGEETGTRVVLSPLPGRGSLTAGDFGLLAVMALLLLLGTGLAWRLRPADNIRALRGRLAPATRGPLPAQTENGAKERS